MGKEQYEVEKILICRVFKGRKQYYLKWKGYTTAEATWEDATNLDCDDLPEEFLKTENKKAPPKKTHKPHSDSEGDDNDKPYKEVDSSDQDARRKKRTSRRSEVSTPTVSEKPSSSRSANRMQRQQKKNKEVGSTKDSGGHASIQNSDGYKSPVDQPKQKTRRFRQSHLK